MGGRQDELAEHLSRGRPGKGGVVVETPKRREQLLGGRTCGYDRTFKVTVTVKKRGKKCV